MTNNNSKKNRIFAGLLVLAALGMLLTFSNVGSAVLDGARFSDSDGDGSCDNFVDGDGYNDNATGRQMDHDGDGIPNGQDDDYTPLKDGSGQQGANGGKGQQSGSGGQGKGQSQGNGGSGGQGSRDGSCEL